MQCREPLRGTSTMCSSRRRVARRLRPLVALCAGLSLAPLADAVTTAPRNVGFLTRAAESQPVVVGRAVNISAPNAGELVRRVGDKLAVQHRTLTNVSASLMAVQSEVDSTEQSLIGRVFDMQTARTLFARHEQVVASNERARDSIMKLNQKVEQLSSFLSDAQKLFVKEGQEQRAAELKVHAQIIEDDAVIEALKAALAKESQMRQALDALMAIRKRLLEQAAQDETVGKEVLAKLKAEEQKAQAEVWKHRLLRSQVVQMHNYSVMCHDRVAKAVSTLSNAVVLESKDNQASLATYKQTQQATEAAQQRLLAENAVLRAEIKKAEGESMRGLLEIRDYKEQTETVKHKDAATIAEVQADITKVEERVGVLSKELMSNAQAEMEAMGEKEEMEKQVKKLQTQLGDDDNEIAVQTLEAQNLALQLLVKEAMKLYKASKAAEAKAIADEQDALAQQQSAQDSVKYSQEANEKSDAQGKASLDAAIEEASENKKKSESEEMAALATIEERCNAEWEVVNTTTTQELHNCTQLEEELDIQTAKKDALKGVLQAREISGSTA